MPSNIIKSFADKTGKSVKSVEKKWDSAKVIVKKEYPKVDNDSDKYWSLVTGTLKKMLGMDEGEATNTLSTIGSTTNKVSNPNSYKYFKKVSKVLKRKKKKQNETVLDRLDDIIKGY